MNILVTCGRFYPSIALVRLLRAAGARVDAADPYKLAPALHSHAVDASHVVTAPTHDPLRFIEDIATIVKERDIDLVIPTFEEGFYLSRYADRIPASIFVAPFETIEALHNKARFVALCEELGLRTPKTITVTDREELRAAIGHSMTGNFVARPAFSRAGQTCFTNHGPRAGEMAIGDCKPTPGNPYLLQEFVEGKDACSFSVVRDGKVVVHCVYEPSVAASGGYAVQFTSIEDFGSLEVASKVAAKFNYNGFLGFDYRRTSDDFVMIECNPRLTAGIFMTPEDWVREGILGTPGETRIAEAGMRRQYDAYMLIGHATSLKPRELIHELLTTPDAVLSAHDILPALYCLINRRHFSQAATEGHSDLASAFTADVAWDGAPMPSPTA